jgi:hypothetical protein
MRRLIMVVVLSAVAGSSQAMTGQPDGIWLSDRTNGCRVWDGHPDPGDAITWSGSCEDGLADGRGTVRWTNGAGPVGNYVGTMSQGKMSGTGTFTWTSGNRYQGQWVNDLPNGSGTYTNSAGAIYTGNWTNGCYRQGDRWAAANATAQECGFK